MERIKRQRCEHFEENERQKFITKVDCNVTQIEDLANEIIFDIFDYLNSYEIYQSFFRLNHRFHSLLMESIISLKIYICLMSSSSFDCYNRDMIIPKQQRIHSILIVNPFMYDDETLSLSNKISLRTLIVENIERNRMRYLLNQLTSLSYLSSLSISTVNRVENKIPIYQQIFRLPSLRYCRLSLKDDYNLFLSPCPINEQSSIEHLIIEDQIKCSEIDHLILYVPQLRRFCLNLYDKYGYTPSNASCYILNNLIHLSIKFSGYSVSFATLEYILINHFPAVKVLRLSGELRSTSVDANNWKQLISTYLLKLITYI